MSGVEGTICHSCGGIKEYNQIVCDSCHKETEENPVYLEDEDQELG